MTRTGWGQAARGPEAGAAAARSRIDSESGSRFGRWPRWAARLLGGTLVAAALAAQPAIAAERVLYSLGLHSNDARNSGGFVGTGASANGNGAVRGPDGSVYVATSGALNDGAVLARYAGNGEFTALHWFNGNSAFDIAGNRVTDLSVPRGTPFIASDGMLYGVAASGGANGGGGIYRVALTGANAGQYRIFHSFNCNTGCGPNSSPVENADGNFYGTLQTGRGSSDGGGVYRLSRTGNGSYTLLRGFSSANAAEGVNVQAPLTLGADGAYYGTTTFGGTGTGDGCNNCGTVFRITTAGVFSSLHSMTAGEGNRPIGPLALGSDGNLYGTNTAGGGISPAGGSYGGTAFRITPAGAFTVLFRFTSDSSVDPANTGVTPASGLVAGSDGNFYGATESAGSNNVTPGCATANINQTLLGPGGTLYRLTPAGVLTTLFCFSFDGNGIRTDGSGPDAALTLGADGRLYGTTISAGIVPPGTTPSNPVRPASGSGTVFSIGQNGSGFARIATFSSLPSEGRAPSGPLLQTADGNFYGVTAGGTPKGFSGSVFQLSPTGVLSTLNSIHYTANAGGSPEGGLAVGPDGAFYGTTVAGGSNGLGAVFRVSAAGDFTNLHSFTGNPDGQQPVTGLTLGSDGNFYGVTSAGNALGNNGGIAFRITPGGNFTKLFDFNGTSGRNPAGRLLLASDGNFYGTTQFGGASDAGTVFRMTPGGTVTVLRSFDGTLAGGINPIAGLVQGLDGALYGTTTGTFGGGSFFRGLLFRLTLGGAFSVVYNFGPGNDVRANGGVIQARDGNFYGALIADNGGSSQDTVYRVTPQGQYSVVYQTTGVPDGIGIQDSLIQALDGSLVAPTRYGGTFGYGAVIAINGPADRVTALASSAGIGSVTLTWPVAPGAVTYNVYQSTTPGGQGGTPIATGLPAAGQTGSYTVTGLTGGTAYYFTITAVNALGETQFSNETSATPTAAAPTVTLAANPASVVLGAASTLTWSSTSATACTASGGWSGSRATSGTASVTPTATGATSYTLTCTGPGGTANASTTVTATAAAPTVTISASPTTITLGGTSTISWNTTNAGSCTASGAWTGARATTGNEVVTPSASGSLSYTLSCTGAGGNASGTATVTVNAPPQLPVPTVTISANPASVTLGSASTLTWSSTDATSCTASGGWTGSRATSGTASVTPAAVGSTSYTLSCTGGGGTASATATVAVNPVPAPAPTVTLAANPGSVTLGASATLTWSTTNATACTASGNWSGSRATSGSESVTPAANGTQTYTLTCTGTGGSANRSVTVTATPPPPAGGGGAVGWLMLVLGGAAAGWRRQRETRH